MFFSVCMLKPALVSFPTPTRGSTIQAAQSRARARREPRSAARRGKARRSRTRDRSAASPPRGLASRAAAEPGQRSAGLSPWGAVTGGRTPRRTWRRERGGARRARSPGSRTRPGRPGARRRARVLPPRAPGAGIRGRRGRPELSRGGGGAGRPGSAALLGG